MACLRWLFVRAARVSSAWLLLHLTAATLRLFGLKPWRKVLRAAAARFPSHSEDPAAARTWGAAVRRAESWSLFRRR